MSKGNTFESDLLKLIFQAEAIANVADNASVSPVSQLYVSLHTASPGEAGTQTTNEASYSGYARVAVARSSSGWTITNNSISPASPIVFPECLTGSQEFTHWGIGTGLSGAGKLLYFGELETVGGDPVSVSEGISPVVGTSSTIIED